jgi:hypothetical protein
MEEHSIYLEKRLSGDYYGFNDFYAVWENNITHNDDCHFDSKLEEDVCRLVGMGGTYTEIADKIKKSSPKKNRYFNKDYVCRIVKKYCERYNVPRKNKRRKK